MNYNAEMPIYLQVIHDLKKKMIQGKILPGEKLPSNRELAVLYKINQNTAARIYREMETHGYCYTKRGIGTFVMEEGNYDDNGRIRPVKAGDMTFTPDGMGHGLTNTGDTDLVFMALIILD